MRMQLLCHGISQDLSCLFWSTLKRDDVTKDLQLRSSSEGNSESSGACLQVPQLSQQLVNDIRWRFPKFRLKPSLKSGQKFECRFPSRSEEYMKPSTLSQRIKDANSENEDVENITQKLESSLDLKDKPQDVSPLPEVVSLEADEEDDWEQLADKELEAPEKPVAMSTPPPREKSPTILELYDFDSRMQMHQIVKSFTKVVDPTGTMPFRPKMVNDSLLLTFSNPKHGILPHII